jgi:hypothetical protein
MLLTIAGTLEKPATGEVLVVGHAVAGMSRDARARLRVMRRRRPGALAGMITQSPGPAAWRHKMSKCPGRGSGPRPPWLRPAMRTAP